jgi:hypothetical protein
LAFQKLFILVILLASVPVLYYGNRWLQRLVNPRASFLRFLLYLVVGMALVFLYTFLVVLLISNLFPLPKR